MRHAISHSTLAVSVMNDQFGKREFVAMMQGAIERVKEGEKYLSELDSACGDGDHGITMLRAVKRVSDTLVESGQNDLKSLIYDVGWTLLGIDGGATGPLLGTLFMGISEGLDGMDSVDPAGLAAIFERGLQAVQRQTKARAGDRTMIDALAPAVTALREAAGSGQDISAMLRSAADSAEQGAASTKNLVARFGKARYSGERSLGHQDAGATSIAMIFRGFYEGFCKSRSI